MDSQTHLLRLVRFGDELVSEGCIERYSGQPGTVSLFPFGLSHSLPAVSESSSGVLPLHKAEVTIGSAVTSWLLPDRVR